MTLVNNMCYNFLIFQMILFEIKQLFQIITENTSKNMLYFIALNNCLFQIFFLFNFESED